jgi:cyclopropane fatty-acyl-phospholipid synthase-like methyltransferase
MTEAPPQALVDLCLVVKNIRKPPWSREEFLEAAKVFPHPESEWDVALEIVVAARALRVEDNRYVLTEKGDEYVDGIIASEVFGKYILRSEQSKAFGLFCERAYGRNLCQFNAADQDQLHELIDALCLDETSRVLDVGCGVGMVTEYISDVTRASILGLDSSRPLIQRAQERTQSKAKKLSFLLGNMNRIDVGDGRFDAITAIDTLYFARNVPETIRQMKALLNPKGRMGLLFSEALGEGDSPEKLEPDKTKLAIALSQNGLIFETLDLSANDEALWNRCKSAAEELKEQFEQEGNADLLNARMGEVNGMLSLIKDGRARRYLYLASIA